MSRARAAYTVSVRGVPQTACVHGHPRGAMVNFLCLEGFRIYAGTPDEAIRRGFIRYRDENPDKQITLTMVLVTPVHEEDPAAVGLLAPPPPVPAEPC